MMRKSSIGMGIVLCGLAWAQAAAFLSIKEANIARHGQMKDAHIHARALAENMATFGILKLPIAKNVSGNIDGDKGGIVRGWAMSEGQPPIVVFLMDDLGAIHSKSTVTLYRPDVATALGDRNALFSGYEVPSPHGDLCRYTLGIVFADLTTSKINLPGCN